MKQERIFSHNFSLLCGRVTEDRVHDLRVAVKKLRSYDKFKQQILETEQTKDWEPIAELFSVLGKYRDLQMNLKLVIDAEKEQKQKFTSLKRFLRSALPEARQRAGREVRKFSIKNFNAVSDQFKKDIASFSQAELIEKIKDLLEKCVKEIKELIESVEDEAHTIRKRFKNIFYWLSACPSGSVITTSKLKSLDKIQDHLGDWQDQRVLYGKIRYYRKEFIPRKTEEYAKYKESEQKIKEKTKLALSDIEGKIKKWVKAF